MTIAQDIFNQAMDFIGTTKTDRYKAHSPGIITAWQNELATDLMIDIPAPITSLTQTITVADKISGAYYLASALLLVEDSDSASFFQEKFAENKKLFLSRRPAAIIPITEVYPDASIGW